MVTVPNPYNHEKYMLHREEILRQVKINYMRNGLRNCHDSKARKFGVTYPTWWLCDICSKPISLARGQIVLEHNHVTNRFRGWTCHRCNRGLGFFGDSMEIIESAMHYLWRAS